MTPDLSDTLLSLLIRAPHNSAVDRLEGELMSELENGRLVRLLCKFGFINERPESVLHSSPNPLRVLTYLHPHRYRCIAGLHASRGGLRPATGTLSSCSGISSSTRLTSWVTPS